jgi:ATP-binding cassette, subfamily B, bacterial PglK
LRELIRQIDYLLPPSDKVRGGLLLTGLMVGAAVEMVGVAAIPVFASLLTQPEVVRSHPFAAGIIEALGIASTTQLVIIGAAALVLLFTVKNAYLAALAWLQARFVFGRQVYLARRLFAAYLESPYQFHLRRNTAELLRNTNHDARATMEDGLMPLLVVMLETLTAAAILTLLLVAEPVTSVTGLVLLGGSTWVFLRVARKRSLRLGEEQRTHQQGMLQAVSEGLGAIKVVKVLGRQGYFLNVFDHAARGYARAGRTRHVLLAVPRLVLETVAVAILLSFAALLLARGRPVASLIPTLTLFAVAVVRLIPAFARITGALNQLRFGRAAVQGVYADLVELEPGPRSDGTPLAFVERLRVEGVSFAYRDTESLALDDISLEIPRGSVVGFVGPTGSGKTTLVDVVLGLLSPTSGRITVDGEDIRGREAGWQRNIGYVPQDTTLVDLSIRQNIAFGVPDDRIDDAAVHRAMDAAQLREFVERLPDGLDSVVGERGVRLSGGQRQRIGIARALYDDPDVLVLDEATSALDHETEHYVLEAIENLRRNRTILIIAHRLTTVRSCDRLFLIAGGRLIGEGTYDDLLAVHQTFERLVRSSL